MINEHTIRGIIAYLEGSSKNARRDAEQAQDIGDTRRFDFCEGKSLGLDIAIDELRLALQEAN